MIDVNKVILLGRLGGAPVQRETKIGTPVTHFSIATSYRVRETESNEAKEVTEWHNIVVWGKLAERCTQYLTKGQPVYIEGSMRSHKYKNKAGEDRQRNEIVAENISFLGGKKRELDVEVA